MSIKRKEWSNVAAFWRWIGRAEVYRTLAKINKDDTEMHSHYRYMMRSAALWAIGYRKRAE